MNLKLGLGLAIIAISAIYAEAQEQHNHICRSNPDAKLPVSGSDVKFYECHNGRLVVRSCSQNYVFNKTWKICLPEWWVFNPTTTESASDSSDESSTDNSNPEDNPNLIVPYPGCPEVYDPSNPVLLAIKGKCNQFVHCDNYGAGYIKDCAPADPPLVFDEPAQRCLYASETNRTDCPSGTSTSPDPTVTPSVPTPGPDDICNGQEEGLQPVPGQCNIFVSCSAAGNVVQQCAPSATVPLVFEPSLQQCVWPWQSSRTDCNSPTPTAVPSSSSSTENPPTPTAVPSSSSSTENPPTPTAVPSSSSSTENSPTPTAVPSSSSSTENPPTPSQGPSSSPTPEPTPTAVPSSSSTTENSPTPTAVPSSSSSTENPPTPSQGPSPTPYTGPTPGPSVCPDVEPGQEPLIEIPGVCNSFIQCTQSGPVVLNCSDPQLVFDGGLKECVWPYQSSRTDCNSTPPTAVPSSSSSTENPPTPSQGPSSSPTPEPTPTAVPSSSSSTENSPTPTAVPSSSSSTENPPTPSQDPSPTPYTGPTPAPSVCPDVEPGLEPLIEIPFVCNSFIQCTQSGPVVLNCSDPQLVFDGGLKECVWPYQSSRTDCNTPHTQSPSPSTSSSTSEPSTATPSSGTSTSESPASGSTSSAAPSSDTSTSDSPSSSTSTSEAPPSSSSTSPNPTESTSSAAPSTATASSASPSVSTATPSPSPVTPIPDSDCSPNDCTSRYLTIANNCNSFKECVGGVSIVRQCSPSVIPLVFDEAKQACVYPWDSNRTDCSPPGPINPSVPSYNCNSTTNPSSAPTTSLPSTTKSASTPTQVTETSPNTQAPSTSTTPPQIIGTCPYGPLQPNEDILLEIAGECNKFAVCTGYGETIIKNCAPTSRDHIVFDRKHQKCVWKYQSRRKDCIF